MEAEIAIMSIGSLASNTPQTMGMRIPKVPQLVPVAKAMPQARRKRTTGIKFFSAPALRSSSLTKSLLPRQYFVMPARDHAKVRMSIAGTIALKPSAKELKNSLKLTILRIM